ncbi:mycothiol synthase [Nocardioides sp. 1609]|uniref:mycothiol synthase n=1 Tax=Nocardioides sp. 1609 TaxID=2508327 RepID=UPI00106F4281|nr:mycothiol synthase [Nocardioides sp. 1609]
MAAPLDVVAAVRAACVEADGHDPLDEAADLALRHRGLEGADLWTEPDGFALVRDGELTLAVAPPARGHGVGGRLARAAEPAAATRAWSHGDAPAAARIAADLGFARTRELWVMRRRTSEVLPALDERAGVEVRGYGHGDAAAVLEVNATAFAHHPEQGGLDADGLAQRMAEPWFDPAGLLLAVDTGTGTLLGFHWTKQHDASLGEVYVVAIGPAAQGRGLGRLLTLAGLHHLAGLGVAEVLLYVESDNAPAVHVYAGLGFEHAATDTHVQYTRPGTAGS